MGSMSEVSFLKPYEFGEHRLVSVKRQLSGKLGFKVRSLPLEKLSRKDETLTLITHIGSCKTVDKLKVFDRIVKINCVDVTVFDENHVAKILSGAGDCVTLDVISYNPSIPQNVLVDWLKALKHKDSKINDRIHSKTFDIASVKRTISTVSGSSDRSSSGSMDGKRNAKRIGRTYSGGSGKQSFENCTSPMIREELQSALSNFNGYHDRTRSVPLEEHISLQDITPCVFEGRADSVPIGSYSLPQHVEESGNELISRQNSSVITPSNLDRFLKYPQHIMWDPQTKVVDITRRRGEKSFGFNFKIKKWENKEGITELFTLVEKIKPKSPAHGHLCEGDYLRSVNGKPIQHSAEELKAIFRENHQLRLLIQRPVGLSVGHEVLNSEQQVDTQDSCYRDGSPRTDVLSDPINLPGSPSIDGVMQFNEPQQRSKHPSAASCASASIRRNSNPPNNITGNQDKCKQFIRQILLSCDHESVKLQRVRVIVCGQEANSFAGFLLSNSSISNRATKMNPNNSFIHLQLAMKLENGEVSLSSWDSDLENKYTRNAANMKLEAKLARMSINIEMFLFQNEKFFHYFGYSLISPSSLLIVTFDCAKMMQNSANEIANLSNLLHTAYSQIKHKPNVLLYGILNNVSIECSSDEVKTLFFTSHGHCLKKYTKEMPEVISLDTESDQVFLLRIFEKLLDSVNCQEVTLPVAAAIEQIDLLSSSREMIELGLMLKDISAQYSCNVAEVANDLLTMRIVMCPSPDKSKGIVPLAKATSPVVILGLLEIITSIPNKFEEMKDIVFKLSLSGKIPKVVLRTLLSKEYSDTSRHLQFLEDLKLIYNVPVYSDTNRSPTEEYLIPYFLMDVSPSVSDGEEMKLFVETDSVMAVDVFFTLTQRLSCIVPCLSADWLGEKSCVIKCKEFVIGLQYLKLQNCVAISLQESSGISALFVYIEWILQACISTFPSDVHYRFGPDCPSDHCSQKLSGEKRHVIDLRQTPPIYCHKKRVDNLSQLRHYFKSKEEPTEHRCAAPTSPSQMPNSHSTQQTIRMKTKISKLPWSVMNTLGLKLSLPGPLYRDWRGLAGLMGKLSEEVNTYESLNSPAYQLLRDWGRQEDVTIKDLMTMLKDPELDRQDIVKYLQNEIDKSSANS